MIRNILHQRINDYAPANAIEQENVLQELMQHYVLVSLSKAHLFTEAVFHGGTCLRILYGTNRFSEDLDFLLKKPSPQFKWHKYLEAVQKDCTLEGIDFEIVDRSDAESAVKKAFLKTDSIGKVLLIDLPYGRHQAKKIRIKLEIDTNPPEGSEYETAYITFPGTAAITTQRLESGFGLKAHALLCREYDKGRDWYDFIWFVGKQVVPNFKLLGNALNQQGPWSGSVVNITPEWFVDKMRVKILELDWDVVKHDVQRFIPLQEQENLSQWDELFFLYQLEVMNRYFEKIAAR